MKSISLLTDSSETSSLIERFEKDEKAAEKFMGDKFQQVCTERTSAPKAIM